MSARVIRQPWTSFLSWQYSVKALSRTAVAACTPPILIFFPFLCMTYWRKDDKIPLHCLKYHHYLPHYLGDWQLQLPSRLYKQAVSTEAWVAVMILYGMMMWVLQHQQFMIEALFFFSTAKFVLVSHTELPSLTLKTVIFSGQFFFPRLPQLFFHGWNIPRCSPKRFHLDFCVPSWGITDGLILVLATLLFHFLLITWLLKCCNSGLQGDCQSKKNIYIDIFGFLNSTSVSQRCICVGVY